jgi:hypothetical protein
MIFHAWKLVAASFFLFLLETCCACQGACDACVRETHIIQGYSALQEELHLSLTRGVKGQLNQCNYTESHELRCLVTYMGRNETLDVYYSMCARAGGKIVRRELDINHNYLGMLAFNVTMEDIPQCVGKSCEEVLIGPEDLFNPVFLEFIEEYEGGDLCGGQHSPMGNLGFWDSVGVEVASWMGVDLADCFDGSPDGTNVKFGEKSKEPSEDET